MDKILTAFLIILGTIQVQSVPVPQSSNKAPVSSSSSGGSSHAIVSSTVDSSVILSGVTNGSFSVSVGNSASINMQGEGEAQASGNFTGEGVNSDGSVESTFNLATNIDGNMEGHFLPPNIQGQGCNCGGKISGNFPRKIEENEGENDCDCGNGGKLEMEAFSEDEVHQKRWAWRGYLMPHSVFSN